LAFNLLEDIFEEIAIELIVSAAFLASEEFAPRTVWSGFYRFLRLLATHDFAGEPILIDINNLLSVEKKEEIYESFAKKRPALPPLVLAIPEDPVGLKFTCFTPETVLLKRVIALATFAYTEIHDSISKSRQLTYKQFLKKDFSAYDLVIRIKPSQVVRKFGGKEKPQKFEEPEHSSTTNSRKRPHKCCGKNPLPIVNYDPVKDFVDGLRTNYNSIALFFWNQYSPIKIGIVFRPSFLADNRSSTVVTSRCEMRIKDEISGVLKPNIPAFIEDIEIIGKCLVRNVQPSAKIAALLTNKKH